MGLFDFMKVCLFSEVNGVVTLEGKPVAGAEIVRTAEINDKPYTDKTVTDENGRFHFDAMYTHSVNKILPMEPYMPQKILIKYKEEEYTAWRTSKRDYYENAEMEDDKNIALKCELTDEPTINDQKLRSNIIGICKLGLHREAK